MSAWAFKWYGMGNKHSPLMELMQEKLHKLTHEQTKALAEEIGVSQVTLFYWRTGHVRHGSGLVMSLLCAHFGLIDAEIPQLSEDDQIALEIRYKNRKTSHKENKKQTYRAPRQHTGRRFRVV